MALGPYQKVLNNYFLRAETHRSTYLVSRPSGLPSELISNQGLRFLAIYQIAILSPRNYFSLTSFNAQHCLYCIYNNVYISFWIFCIAKLTDSLEPALILLRCFGIIGVIRKSTSSVYSHRSTRGQNRSRSYRSAQRSQAVTMSIRVSRKEWDISRDRENACVVDSSANVLRDARDCSAFRPIEYLRPNVRHFLAFGAPFIGETA